MRRREIALRRRLFMMLISCSANSGFCWSATRYCLSSRPITVQALFARAAAVRAAPAITAISPNTSPALTEPMTRFCTSISISPTMRMYMRAREKIPAFSFS